MNIRSIRVNVTLINSFLIDNKCPNIICFTETWLHELDSAVISDITGDQYCLNSSTEEIIYIYIYILYILYIRIYSV